MKERLPLEGKECLLMEGIFQNNQNMEAKPKEQYKTIMYTGGIYWRRGTDMLLDAFNRYLIRIIDFGYEVTEIWKMK